MIDLKITTKYSIDFTTKFKKEFKKIIKQHKDLKKFEEIVTKLANLEQLEPKYHNHDLVNNKYFKNCKECHIEPDWLLVYQYINEKLILLLVETGSHAELF